jgi:hypothetical protein
MEAAACGTPIVSTNDFALKETVAHNRTGYLINGNPNEDEYQKKFVRKTEILLTQPEVYKAFSEAGPEWVKEQGYTWDAVAESWERLFLQKMEERWQDNSIKIIQELTRKHDLVAAIDLAYEADLPQTAEDLGKAIIRAEPEEPECSDDVLKMVKQAVPRFQRAGEALARNGYGKPEHILDYSCGYAGFGLFAAQMFPEAKITMTDPEPHVVQQIQANIDQAALGARVKVHHATTFAEANDLMGGCPDVTFLGSTLEQARDPWNHLDLAVSFTKTGGCVLTVSRCGADTATIPESHSRIWNFDQADYIEMIGEDHSAHLNFLEEDISDGGDLIGYWLCLVPVPATEIKCRPIDVQRRKFITRPYQSLAVCMIAKDGEDHLVKCLKHLLPIADKMVIALDDRTSDHTEDIIEWADPGREKIEIRKTTFENFAQARNESIRDVDTDWILWVDTDEMVVDYLKLRRYLYGSMMEGYSLKQCHLMLDVHGTFDIPVRLFRNKPYYKFVGFIHEHCEDTRGGFDTPIKPAMLLQDDSLAP